MLFENLKSLVSIFLSNLCKFVLDVQCFVCHFIVPCTIILNFLLAVVIAFVIALFHLARSFSRALLRVLRVSCFAFIFYLSPVVFLCSNVLLQLFLSRARYLNIENLNNFLREKHAFNVNIVRECSL